MKTDTSLLVVGGADEQVSFPVVAVLFVFSTTSCPGSYIFLPQEEVEEIGTWELSCYQQFWGCHILLDNSTAWQSNNDYKEDVNLACFSCQGPVSQRS